MCKIQCLISEQEKEIFLNLNNFISEKINETIKCNKNIMKDYKTINLQFWLKNVIDLPIEKHTVYSTFKYLKISTNSYAFNGHGKIQLFNYLDEDSIQEHYTFFSFNYKVDKTQIKCSIRARNLPGLEHIEYKEKIKVLKWADKIENFSFAVKNIRKLNETTTIKS